MQLFLDNTSWIVWIQLTNLDVLNGLPAVVGNDDVGGDLLPMVVDFAVKSDFQVDLSIPEGEALAYEGARETTATASGRILQLQIEDRNSMGGKKNYGK